MAIVIADVETVAIVTVTVAIALMPVAIVAAVAVTSAIAVWSLKLWARDTI